MQNFLREIRAFGFGQIPKGWVACNGQLMSINANQPLFSLLGTTYGGNGSTTFGLPNLQGRVSLSSGQDPSGATYTPGQTGGEQQHVLTIPEMPQHNHTVNASNSTSGPQSTPSASTVLGVGTSTGANPQALDIYGTGAARGTLASQTVGNQGANQGHENRMPYLAVNYCIALQGIYPSRS